MAVSLHYVLKGATSWAIEELCDRLVERIGRQFEYFESPKAQRRLFFIMWNVERL